MEKNATEFQMNGLGESSFASQRRPAPEHEAPREPQPQSDPRLLALVVANDIIPRLLLAHRLDEMADDQSPAPQPAPPTPDDIAQLVEIAVAMDTDGAVAAVEARISRGESYEAALLDFVGGAARMLGEQWFDDERSFADVTIGLATLHRVVSVMRHRLRAPGCSRGLVLLLVGPGEQHTLAIHILGDLLVQAGWDADVRPVFEEAELVATVATEAVVMVGISMSTDCELEPVTRTVGRIRAASLNRDVTVLLGGATDLSDYAKKIGAHYFADARHALDWLDRRGTIAL